MSSPTACAAEREEMRELEEERRRTEDIDEATKTSREIAMLDSRVARMLEDLRKEMDSADGDIGQVRAGSAHARPRAPSPPPKPATADAASKHPESLPRAAFAASKRPHSVTPGPQAFRALDLDGDGVMSHEELLEAMEQLDLSQKPYEAAFKKLLEKIDWDADAASRSPSGRRSPRRCRWRRRPGRRR